MKKTILKIMAFILPIALLLPCMPVLSETSLPTTLYVGSTQVISGGTVTGATSGEGWEYDSTSNTLNLTGANITGVKINSGSLGSVGIYADGDLNITFSDTNYVTAPGATSGFDSKGIWVKGKLTLSGEGTLNIESLDTTSPNGGSYAIGMHTANGFNITSGTVNIRSGNTTSNTTTGVSSGADSYVSGNAVLNVSTGDLTGGAYQGTTGMTLNSGKANLYVSDNASVTVMSGKSDYLSVAIKGNIIASGNSKITATSSEINVAGSVYSYAINGAISISDSAVIIGKSEATNPSYWKFGIYGDISAEDGYYWRTSTTGDYTKSGTTAYNKTSSSYAEIKGHSHSFPEIYEHDETQHWRSCNADCPVAAKEIKEHSYGDNGACACGVSIPFKITEQPQGQTVEYAYRSSIALTVAVDEYVDADKIKYQWYENGEPISYGTKNTFYVTPGKKVGTYEYYCEVSTTDTSYSKTTEKSSTATVTVVQRSLADSSWDYSLNYVYTGEIIKKFLNVRVNNSYLKEGTDYIVQFTLDDQVVDPIIVGKYTMTVIGINGYKDEKSVRIVIQQATPKLGEITYSGIVSDKTKPEDVILNRENETVPGVLALDSTNVFELNKTEYSWTFTPTDTHNYKTVKGTIQIDVKDVDLPAAEVTIGDNSWNKFDNTISDYELFTKESITVNVTAQDNENGSGINKVEYYISDGILHENEKEIPEDAWTKLTETDGKYTFTITNNAKGYLYIRATDNHNNQRIINTSGIVKYAEVTDAPKSITYTKQSDKDIFVEVDFKGNKVKEIKYKENVLRENQAYFVSANGITFSAGFLNTFAAGSGYKFVISYYAQGVETEEVDFTTTINLTVKKMIPQYKIPTILEGTYCNKLSNIKLPAVFTWNAPNTSLSKAGKIKFKATYTPTDKDNYEVVKDIEISVNVLPKNIKDATVTLGESLIYTGEEQTQTIKSVILDGEKVTYSITGATATEVGDYSLTITGTGNFTGTITVPYSVASDSSISSETVDEVLELIDKIPANITIEDKDAIKAAEKAYNSLTKEEKKLIDSDIKARLDDATEQLEELEENESEKEESNNIFLWIILVIVALIILIATYIKKRKEQLAN